MSAILVVDDEPAIVETVAELLAWDGHSVVTANDGAAALAILTDGRQIDVVIMDFMMPVKDGVETLREIRANAVLAPIKVILTTAVPSALPKDGPRFDALLPKPFSYEQLAAALDKVLSG